MHLISQETNTVVVNYTVIIIPPLESPTFEVNASINLASQTVLSGFYFLRASLASNASDPLMSVETPPFRIRGGVIFDNAHKISDSYIEVTWVPSRYPCDLVVPYAVYRWDFDFNSSSTRTYNHLNTLFLNISGLDFRDSVKITEGMTNIADCSVTTVKRYKFVLNWVNLGPRWYGMPIDGYYAIRLTLPDIGVVNSVPFAVLQPRTLSFRTSEQHIIRVHHPLFVSSYLEKVDHNLLIKSTAHSAISRFSMHFHSTTLSNIMHWDSTSSKHSI